MNPSFSVKVLAARNGSRQLAKQRFENLSNKSKQIRLGAFGYFDHFCMIIVYYCNF